MLPTNPRPSIDRDLSEMQAYLDTVSDAPGLEIEYHDAKTTRTQRLYGAVPVSRTFERPAAAKTLRCYPVDPASDVFTVRVDEIQRLQNIDLPDAVFGEVAETPAAEAIGLTRLAAIDTAAVPLPKLLHLLNPGAEDPARTRQALKTLRTYAAERPTDATTAIPVLRGLLTYDELGPVAARETVKTLRILAEADAEAVAPVADDLRRYLNYNFDGPPKDTARAFAAIAEIHPEDVIEAVPALADLIDDREKGLAYATYTLALISRDTPAAIKPVAATLGRALADESINTNARLSAASAFGRTVAEDPALGVEYIDAVLSTLESSDHKLRNNATAILGDIAQTHSDVVKPHVDDLAPYLTVDDRFTRVNTSGALSRVAEDFPESVEHLTGTFIDLLADDDPLVRTNACWTLGYLEADEAVGVLGKRAHEDDDQEVRNRAAWAHARITK